MRKSPLSRSSMARVNEGSHSLPAIPHVYPQVEPAIDRVQALADISRSALYVFAVYKLTYVYVVIATKPVHRLQIRPIVHN